MNNVDGTLINATKSLRYCTHKKDPGSKGALARALALAQALDLALVIARAIARALVCELRKQF